MVALAALVGVFRRLDAALFCGLLHHGAKDDGGEWKAKDGTTRRWGGHDFWVNRLLQESLSSVEL